MASRLSSASWAGCWAGRACAGWPVVPGRSAAAAGAGPGWGAAAAQDLVGGLREGGFVCLAVAAPVEGGADVAPGGLAHRGVDVVAVDPRDLVQVSVGQPDVDLAYVMRVEVDLPFAAGALG